MTLWFDARTSLPGSTPARADWLYDEQLNASHRRLDRLFAILLLFEWLLAVVFALLISPYAWFGESARIHIHVWTAIVLGAAIVSLPIALVRLRPGAALTRHVVASAQMLLSVLLIHLSGGRIETHFHIFGSLAFLALYRDWRVLITASVIVVADHFLRGVFWPRSIYGVRAVNPWRWLEHSAWVVFEDIVLVLGCLQSLRGQRTLALRQAELETARHQVEQIVTDRTAELQQAIAAMHTEVAERRRVEHALRGSEAEARERQRFVERLTDANPSMIFLFDISARRTTFINSRISTLLGYNKEQIDDEESESLIVRLVNPDDAIRLGLHDPRGRFEHVSDGQVVETEFRSRHADGSWRWVRCHEVVFRRDQTGEAVEILGTVEDITERKEAEEKFHVLFERSSDAHMLFHEKDGIIDCNNAALRLTGCPDRKQLLGQHPASISDEYQPDGRRSMEKCIEMDAIARRDGSHRFDWWIRRIDTELSPRQREFLGLVKSSSDSLLTVINDILDFSRIEAGMLNLDPLPFSLRDTIDETLHALALRAHSQGLELACRAAPDVPSSVVGDAGRLRQVLVNLVGNAIKFTARGEILVSVGIEEFASDSVVLRFSVADTGIGIPAEKLDTIFQPFAQADGSTTRRFGGSGLGLTISAKLVELMGGNIWVESQSGVGSTFWFTVALGAQPHDNSGHGDVEYPHLEGLPVLIVDDNATNRRILEEVLTNWGARPVAVDRGRAALQALRAAADQGQVFPIALIDGMMPGMDGLELAKEIRRDPPIASVRLVLLTSAGQPDDVENVRSLNIAACLTKPVRQSELFDTLMKVMAGSEQPKKVQVVTHQDKQLNHQPATQTGLRILLAEDHPVNQKVAVRMLERLGHQIVVADDGRKALEALEAGRFDVVLMDVQMPEMDGFEAVRIIRAHEATTKEHLTIIALTAHAMQGDRERCLLAGFDSYLAKPIRQHELQTALDSLERRSPDTPVPARGFLEQLNAICGGDDEFRRELAESFLESAPRWLSGIAMALEHQDSGTLAAQAHALKGISRTIRAEDLATLCEKLEECTHRDNFTAAAVAAARLDDGWEQVRTALERLVPLGIKK
jgi:two-component system sensor histidine kinase/response regulator